MIEKTFSAHIENLAEMLEFVKIQAREAGFEQEVVTKIELAAEEALVNIINYSYPKSSGEIHITCMRPTPLSGLKIIIYDKGVPFDPLNYQGNEKQGALEERETGGYGIYLILQVMDHVDYQRVEDGNLLSFIKYL